MQNSFTAGEHFSYEVSVSFGFVALCNLALACARARAAFNLENVSEFWIIDKAIPSNFISSMLILLIVLTGLLVGFTVIDRV